jgi:nucleotide-binding universal stress UspA family protein
MKTPLWNTILVPHDFSGSANRAAAIARDEARTHAGRIVLLHVVELPPHFGPETTLIMGDHGTPVGMQQYAISRATAHLDDIATRLAKDGVIVNAIVRVGTPVEVIAEVAAEQRAEVIVMGTHGRTGINRLVTGSVAERVVRSSRIPVMTIRELD